MMNNTLLNYNRRTYLDKVRGELINKTSSTISTAFNTRNFNSSAHTIKIENNSVSNFNPVLSYENADILKDSIIRDNRGKSGVYR